MSRAQDILLLLLLLPLVVVAADPALQDAAYQAVARLHAHLEDVRSAWADDDLMRAACARRPPGLPESVRRLLGDPDGAVRLWRLWRASAASTWTPEEVHRWAEPHLLAPSTVRHRQLPIGRVVAGPQLPLLTEPDGPAAAPLLTGLEAEERRRLAARATELVLLGPNRRPPSVLQHLLLATLGFLGLGGVWLVGLQKKFFEHNRRLFAGRSSQLVHAEKSLANLQEKLASAEQQSAKAAEEKQRLEEAYKREISRLKDRAWRLSHERRRSNGEADAAAQLALAEQEVAHLRALLEQSATSSAIDAGGLAGARTGGLSASAELLHLLRLCYETELRYCSGNRLKAEEQLARASESLQKLLRKQYTVMGVFRSALNLSDMVSHVEKEIVTAKDFSDKVKLDIQERIQRWSRVEELMGIEIIPKQEPPPVSLRTYDNIRSYAVRWKLKTATETSMRRMAMENAAASLVRTPGSAASLSTTSGTSATASAIPEAVAAPAAAVTTTSSAPSPSLDEKAMEDLVNQLKVVPAKRNSVPSISLGRILADSKQALQEAENTELRRLSQPTFQSSEQEANEQPQQQQQSPLTASADVVFNVPTEGGSDENLPMAHTAEAVADEEATSVSIEQQTVGPAEQQLTELPSSSASMATASVETASASTPSTVTSTTPTASIATSSPPPASLTTGRKRRSIKLLKYFGSGGSGKSKSGRSGKLLL
ncbi:hypothetical protein BOX15_Mlig030611g1 [Macrostomum lignano]|uniref:STIM1/2 Orai1-activating region domain-containing protein n=1 Tax=Macrostomum lignano TaxID=282301 RepID=A0A267G337_9PLAT|nr:hypothetical protein BOX15_Mlig030611g1 [Macrostomum lignano]